MLFAQQTDAKPMRSLGHAQMSRHYVHLLHTRYRAFSLASGRIYTFKGALCTNLRHDVASDRVFR